MYALMMKRSHAGPAVLPQAQTMATIRPSSMAIIDSWMVIHVPLASRGQAANTSPNWNV